jgi:hypothetical protein
MRSIDDLIGHLKPPSINRTHQEIKRIFISSPTDHRRQALFAALLKFSPEALPLRERILDRVVLNGLLGSSLSQPFTIDRIQQKLLFGYEAPIIPREDLEETLARLSTLNKIERNILSHPSTYYIRQNANSDLDQAYESGQRMLENVISRMIKDTSHLITPETAKFVFQTFIFECFSRFGRKIARGIVGQVRSEELLSLSDLTEAFDVAINTPIPSEIKSSSSLSPETLEIAVSLDLDDIDALPLPLQRPLSMFTARHMLSFETLELLRSRCTNFIKSNEIHDHQLKFLLTQGYYLAQLLGLEDRAFNPIIEQAFHGTVLYLDIDVLISILLSSIKEESKSSKIIGIANRLGIQLFVTRFAISQIKQIAITKINDIKKISQNIPDEISLKSNDEFLITYIEAKKRTRDATVEEVFWMFEGLEEFLTVSSTLQLIINTTRELLT